MRDGRRREFKSFAAFADDTGKIPDPTERETFEASKLDWSERSVRPTARCWPRRPGSSACAATWSCPWRSRATRAPPPRCRGRMWSIARGASAPAPCASSPMSGRALRAGSGRRQAGLDQCPGRGRTRSSLLDRRVPDGVPLVSAVNVRTLEQLADLVGVAGGYTDAFGKPVETSLEVRRGLLAALGFAVDDDDAVAESLAAVERLRRGLIPRFCPWRPAGGRAFRCVCRRACPTPGLAPRGRARYGPGGAGEPAGVRSRLRAAAADAGLSSPHRAGRPEPHRGWVIAAPQRCWRPRPYTEEGASDWGLAAQLYGLRSATNIGIGTYADAGEAAARRPCAGRRSWA